MLRIEIIKDKYQAEHCFQTLLENLYSEKELIIKSKNPFLVNYLHVSFAVFENDVIAAFASVFINSEILDEDVATIGNFECLENVEVATAVFSAIEKECKLLQIRTIIGPMNGSTWEKYRFPKPSSHPLFFTEDVYLDYYHSLFTENGFEEYEKFVSNKQELLYPTPEQYKWFQSFIDENSFTLSYVPKANYINELPRIYEFCNVSFAGNRLFSPISQQDFIIKYTQLKDLIHPISVLLIENSESQIVGLLLSIPNLYSKNELILKTMAVHPDFRSKGIANAFGIELMNVASKYQFESIIHAFMHENNHSKNVSEKYSGEVIREYVLYKKSL